MTKPVLGAAVGAALGVLDGASAWAYPEARPMIATIVVSSTIKGALTGVLAGFVAHRTKSTGIGIATGLTLGALLSVIAAATSPADPNGSQHYFEIVLPGMLLGAIVGFVTIRYPRQQPSRERTHTPHAALVLLLLTVPATVADGQTPSAKDSLQPLDFFAGTWRGTSSGRPGEGTVEREYTRILNGRFLRSQHRGVYPPQAKNPKGEVHEDIAFISFDRTRGRFVLRQFHGEGFVNQYVTEPTLTDSRKWVFTSEAIENIPAGWRARETYTILGPDEFEELFELAEPGKDFELYSRTRLSRVR